MLHAAGSRWRALLAPPHTGSVFHGRISAASRAAGPASPPASVSSGSEEQLSQRCWVCQNPTRSCLSCSIWALSQHEGPPPPPQPGPLRWEQAKKESCFPKRANRHGANKTSRTVFKLFYPSVTTPHKVRPNRRAQSFSCPLPQAYGENKSL